MHPFKHKTSIQLRFKDIDKMGHVNNANHLTYIETARIKYFEDVVGSGAKWSQQLGIILARIEIDYRSPILLHDAISVYTRCARIGTKSIQLNWAIVREKEQSEETVAEGISVMVCYDYVQNKTVAVPDLQKQKILQYEGSSVQTLP